MYGPCAACGAPVKREGSIWCSTGCVPVKLRAEWAKKARRVYAYRRRATFFRLDLEAFAGRRITYEQLLELVDRVWDRGYQAGYHTCDDKWRRRENAPAGPTTGC